MKDNKELKFEKYELIEYEEFISKQDEINKNEIIILPNDGENFIQFENIKSKMQEKNVHLFSYENKKFFWQASLIFFVR